MSDLPVIYCDASASRVLGRVGYGLVLDGDERFGELDSDPNYTVRNELMAVLEGLVWASELGLSSVLIALDNEPAFDLLIGTKRPRKPELVHLMAQIDLHRVQYDYVKFLLVPGEDNPADAPARKGYYDN